jgi:DNA-binding FadR family transcriptional regulator
MRVVAEIPHEVMKITLFQWNGKYILKFEISQFEQSYKFNELDYSSYNEIIEMINKSFLLHVLKLFSQMRDHYQLLLETK